MCMVYCQGLRTPCQEPFKNNENMVDKAWQHAKTLEGVGQNALSLTISNMLEQARTNTIFCGQCTW